MFLCQHIYVGPDHRNCSLSVHLRQLVISSFPFIHHCDEYRWSPLRACVWKIAFKLATGFFVMGLTRSWWETPMVHWGRLKGERSTRGWGEVGGTHWGSFLWWHSETDLAGSPRCCSHLCVWTLPSLLTYSTKPSQGFRDTVECVVGCQSYDCKLWCECVWEFRGRVQLICHIWEFEDSSSFTSKIK